MHVYTYLHIYIYKYVPCACNMKETVDTFKRRQNAAMSPKVGNSREKKQVAKFVKHRDMFSVAAFAAASDFCNFSTFSTFFCGFGHFF